MKTFRTMFKTELKLSLRGMDMFIFAICLPLTILAVLGVMFGNRPASPGADYTFLDQSFGALASISICAGGVMGLPLVISDYRSRKILKRFQVTPVSPAMILFVQAAIYTLYAVSSLILLWICGKLFFGLQIHGSFPLFLAGYLLVMISMFSLGMMVGGMARDTKNAGVIASILYFPMLIFSGATLPYEVMPASMQKVSDLLLLTQGIKLLKAASLGLPSENILPPAAAMAVLAFTCIGLSLKFFKWE